VIRHRPSQARLEQCPRACLIRQARVEFGTLDLDELPDTRFDLGHARAAGPAGHEMCPNSRGLAS
jgi:hypothetical protein